MSMTTLEITVRTTELDYNGHVNNAKYLEYLEWGRVDWYDHTGLTYEKFDELGMQTVTVNININYQRECRLGDHLTIKTFPQKMGRSSYVLKQEVINQRGEVCADALVTSVVMDLSTRKGVKVPDPLQVFFNT